MNKLFYRVWMGFSIIMCIGWAYLCCTNYQKGNTTETFIALILTVIFLIGFIVPTIIVLRAKK